MLLKEKILKLKKEKNAVILAHNYQTRDIIEIADFIGDSFELAKKAQNTQADIIVFCGVQFMAESAKILNPQKKVLLPSLDAGCFMADKINKKTLNALKKQYPKAAVVAYINTNADLKAEIDVCCTSANALKIIEKIKNNEIIFVPDRHLAEYVQSQTKKKIIPYPQGYCFLHTNIQPEKILHLKKQHPKAEILMHPETPLALHKYANYVYGTGGMIKHVQNSQKNKFLIATEEHMSSTLKFLFPKKEFIPLMRGCRYMEYINLENTLEALEKERYEITVNKNIAQKAKIALEKMIDFSQ